MRPGVGGIEHVLLELRLQLRELQHHGLEARLALGVERHARQAEVAQRVLEHAAAARRRALPPSLLGDRAVGAIQRLALRQVGLVRGQQRQAGVVGGAQRLGIHHRIQMARPATRCARCRCCSSSSGSTTVAKVGGCERRPAPSRRARLCGEQLRASPVRRAPGGCSRNAAAASWPSSGFSMDFASAGGRHCSDPASLPCSPRVIGTSAAVLM